MNSFHVMLILLSFCQWGTVLAKNSTKLSVLFIMVDDLRATANKEVNLTHIARLARNSVTFTNAFAQQALCAPSRTSLLTGRRPDSLHLYDAHSYWREQVGNFVTLPQYFKSHGYKTFSVGKIFHPGISSNYTDDYPYSWSEQPYHPPTLKYKNAPVCPDRQLKKRKRNLVCPVHVDHQPGKTLPDLESLDYAVDILEDKALKKQPIFLAVGLQKPHIPLKFPKEFLKKVPFRKIIQPLQPNKPAGMPLVAWHPWVDVRRRDDIARLDIPMPMGIMPMEWTFRIKQSYFAAALYIDDIIGALLRRVDLKRFIVVITSDHGWSLGENGMWAKYSNSDFALKVPLIIHAPGYEPRLIDSPVELLDIFPTLVELAHLSHRKVPRCASLENVTDLCFDGKSLVRMMKGDTKPSAQYAISQYPRPSKIPQINSDEPKLKDIKIMGYSIRTKRFRYTEWIGFNSMTFKKMWHKNFGTELYDYALDPYETENVHLKPEYKSLKYKLQKQLRSRVV
ncbi:iduronate 2-sulfatase [Hyposmocoma kahamanoa]|uniref:iduronate 2-sulfatase n=1 Tax=Hyposmocoma kahamanoa TaxID=1477025 RepID=UPI000E6D8521|nr:iduronate 2-sulfatase [Hyposmocoma kahamanoa]